MRTTSLLRFELPRTFRWAVLALGVAVPACSDSSSQTGMPGPGVVTPDDGTGTPAAPGPSESGMDPPVNPMDPPLGSMPFDPPAEVQGTETPVPATYWPLGVEQGVVDPEENLRAVITFPLRNQAELESRIAAMYNPASPQFRRYMTVAEFMASYAPAQDNVDATAAWLTSKGFKVALTARNRLLLYYTGTVGQWNAAFGVTLHHMKRSPTTVRDWSYAPITPVDVPQPLVGKIKRLLMPDVEVPSDKLPPETAPVLTTPPSGVSTKLVPSQIASAYGINELYAKGYKGAGMTIGIIGATTFRVSDAQSMWQTFGINRKTPTVVEPMEPMYTRGLETALDVQLAGAIAPEAEVIFYGGPNTSDTTLIYTFNEAIAANQAQVLSDSFAHAEASSPAPVARAYNEAAMMAAALGITIVSASGDSNQVDMPSNSPYVTAVGGTNVELNADGSWKHEQSWEYGGCGRSKVFAQPLWQKGAYAKANGQRTVADVGVVVGPSWVKFLGNWTYADGTSGSTPVFGALLLLVDQARKAQGKPPVGFINSLIYQHAATRGAFRDIVDQGIGGCATLVGYDLATGIGSPKAAELAVAIP